MKNICIASEREWERAYTGATDDQRAQARQSPSPTHVSLNGHHAQVRQGHHQRRDSDTLRSAAQYTKLDGSDQPSRFSPSGRSLSSSTAVGSTAGVMGMRHHRSPTAPEVPTTSTTLVEPHANGKTNGAAHLQESRHQVQQQSQQQPFVDVKTRNLIVRHRLVRLFD